MPTLDTIRSLTIRGSTPGVPEATAALNSLSGAQTKVAQSAGVMATQTDASAKKVLSAAPALERLAKQMDANYKASTTLAAAQVTLDKAYANGLSGTPAYIAAQTAIARSLRDGVTANDNSARSHLSHGAAANNNRMAMLELGHVFRSVSDELAAGVPLTRALTVESGRLFEIVSNGGISLGTLRESLADGATKMAAFVNPITLGATAIIGFGAAALYAASAYRTMQDEMARATMGVGHMTGLSGSGLMDLADASSVKTGVGISDSRANAATLASTGKLDPTNISGVMGLTRGYASAFGTSYGDAGTQLADIFKDPTAGATKLNERLGFLNDGTQQYIKTLEDQGRHQEAVRALIDAASASMGEFVKPQGPWERMIAHLSDQNAKWEKAIGGGQPTALDRYYDTSQESNTAGWYNLTPGATSTQRSNVNDAEDLRRQAMLSSTSSFMMSQQDTLNANRQSIIAGDLVRSLVPEILARQDMVDQRAKLQTALDTPGTKYDPHSVMFDPAAARAAADAMDHLNIGIATFATSAERLRQDSAARVASLGADDAAGKLAIDTQAAYVKTLQDSKNAALAAATAETNRAEAVANATKRLDDMVVSLDNQTKLVGLNPTLRIEEERRQALEAIQQNNAIPAGPAYGPSSAAITSLGADDLTRFATAIKAVESSGGNYGALGPTTASGDRAYGAYQVMGANIPSWTKEATGQSLSPSEFLANQAAQDAVFKSQFSKSLSTYGNANDAASMWFTGRPLSHGAGARDALGTSGADYVNRFDAALPGSTRGAYVGGAVMPGTDTSGAIGSTNSLYDARKADLYAAPFRSATDQLGQMDRALKAQQDEFGLSADKVAGINERLKLENELVAAGATSLDPYKAKLDEIQLKWQASTKAIEDATKAQKDLISNMDTFRSVSSDGLHTFTNDMLSGKSATDAARDAISSMGQKIISVAEDNMLKSFFGASGTPGGGLFGNGLSSMFQSFGGASSTASASTASMPAVSGDAAVLGTLYHGGGLVGSEFGAGSRYVHPAHFDTAPRFHSGIGPDEVPAILQKGESVLTAGQMRALAPASSGGGGGDMHVQVINNHPSASVTPQISRGPNGQRQLRVMVSDMLAQEAASNGRGYRAFMSRGTSPRVGS